MATSANTCWSIAFDALVALGTITVAALAIWGEWFRHKWAGPKPKLEPHNFRGSVTTLTARFPAIYYHLKVTNRRKWAAVRNCRVFLKQLHRRGPDGEFRAVPLVVPLQYVWAPAEWAPIEQSFSTEAVLDFGRLVKGSNVFEPTFYVTSANFQGFVAANEAVRYTLQIVAENYGEISEQIFEVAWDGNFSENLDQMRLVIKEIPKET
jgi:hypothetical protein